MLNSVTLGVSGASGLPYGLRLLDCLIEADLDVHLVISQAAQVVAVFEKSNIIPSKQDLQKYLKTRYEDCDRFHLYGYQEWTAPIASGSACAQAMVVCPCSAGTLSAIATGASNNLLERAADVSLKERKPLILVTRETPVSAIFLRNCLTLSEAGAVILPASPGFYHQPQTVQDLIDFVVARILIQLNLPQDLIKPWGED